jgi:hypothetical protein
MLAELEARKIIPLKDAAEAFGGSDQRTLLRRMGEQSIPVVWLSPNKRGILLAHFDQLVTALARPAADEPSHPNRDALSALASQLPFSVAIAPTDAYGDRRLTDGYFTAYAAPDGRKGFTAVCHGNGELVVSLETVASDGSVSVDSLHGNRDDAEPFGRSVAGFF